MAPEELLKRTDVSEVVNACDSGREGELIFRLVYEHCGCKKPVKRLWISSMEDSAIRDGFADLKDGAEYESLYSSALCRSQADWIVGLNATRLFSTVYNVTLSVGRVQSPTFAMLVKREADRVPLTNIRSTARNSCALRRFYGGKRKAQGKTLR